MKQAFCKRRPIAQAFAVETNVFARIVDVAKMRKKEALGVPRRDGLERGVPKLKVDVGRRRRR